MSGVLGRLASEATDVTVVKTVVRAPTVTQAETPLQEQVDVFNQMDTPVRDWFLEQLQQPTAVQTAESQVVEAQVHQQEGRPATPTIRSPTSEDSWPGTPNNPKQT